MATDVCIIVYGSISALNVLLFKKKISSGPTVEKIIPRMSVKPVVARLAKNIVIPRAAINRIIAIASLDPILRAVPGDIEIRKVAPDRIVTISPKNAIASTIAEYSGLKQLANKPINVLKLIRIRYLPGTMRIEIG